MVKIIITLIVSSFCFEANAQNVSLSRLQAMAARADAEVQSAKKAQAALQEEITRAKLIETQLLEDQEELKAYNLEEVKKDLSSEDEPLTQTEEKTKNVIEQVEENSKKRSNIRQGFGKVEQ